MSIESFLSAHQLSQTVHIMRHQESVLPGIALGVVPSLELRIEILGQRSEITLGVQGTHTLHTLVPQLMIVLTEVIEAYAVLLMSQFACHLCHSPTGQIILQVLGHCLSLAAIIGQITEICQIILSTQGQTPHLGILCGKEACLHGLKSLFLIDISTLALENHVCQHRNTWFAHHAVSLTAGQMPHGQLAMFTIDGHHGIGIV